MNPNANSFQWKNPNDDINNNVNTRSVYSMNSNNNNQSLPNDYYGDEYGYDERGGGGGEGEYINNMDMGMNMGMNNMDMGMGMNNMDMNMDMEINEPTPGTFYPLTQPYMPHIQSSPISALAIDPALNAIYVAGHTITLNKKRRHATYSTPGGGGSSSISSSININNSGLGRGSMMNHVPNHNTTGGGGGSNISDQRVSMLATHSFPDGMLYSSIAAHDEARKGVLDQMAVTLYGDNTNASTSTSTASNNNNNTTYKIPKHAYRPPYNRPLDQKQQNAMMITTASAYQKRESNMGIHEILPFSSPTITTTNNNDDNSEGYLATVSPSSVRVHSRGGLLLSENKVEGLMSGSFHPGGVFNDEGFYDDKSIASNVTHITVGGISCPSNNGGIGSGGIGIGSNSILSTGQNCPNLYCMDLYSSTLKIVASHTVRSAQTNIPVGITNITTNHETGHIVAGCSDGSLRLFDGSWRGGNYMECEQVKAHGGGIAQVAVAGNLICTTGYSSRSSNGYNSGYGNGGSGGGSKSNSSLYAFPDEHVLIFDIRYLGRGDKSTRRGGMPHPFNGLNGGPRFLSFLPRSQDESGNHKVLVGSGQVDGGLQIITPFTGLMSGEPDLSNFIKPPLNPEGEAITAMHVVGKDMAIGTSMGNILQYRMAGYGKSTIPKSKNKDQENVYSDGSGRLGSGSGYSMYKNEVSQNKTGDLVDVGNDLTSSQKEALILPSYEVDPPLLSIEPHALKANNPRNEVTSHSIFNSYILQNEPVLSSLVDGMGKPNPYSFGILTESIIKQSSKRILSKKLLDIIDDETKKSNDFLISIPTSKLDLDLGVGNEAHLPNANKLLHGGKRLGGVCYNAKADPRTREKRDRKGRRVVGHDDQLPRRYAIKNRPLNSRFSAFDFASLNNTNYPGWDYVGPNAYSCPVLLLLYFVPEIRNIMLHSQLQNLETIISGKKPGKAMDAQLCTELGFLFHQIDCLASHGMVYPKPPGEKEDPCRNILRAFVPSNFMSTFMMMPESSALALLDGNPAATEIERRPEAFYRFLLHHLDKEINSTQSTKRQGSRRNIKNLQNGSKINLIDSLYGMNAVSMNTFVNEGAGSQSVTTTRSNTVDLAYDSFLNRTEESSPLPNFGEILRFSLCKDVPLRVRCNATQSYETVIQRKIITSLPKIMSLSCACAGVNGEDRLPVWRKREEKYNSWLPESIEVEIEDDGNVITRQLRANEWQEFRGEGLPQNITDMVREATAGLDIGQRRARYQLQAIVTFINTDAGGESRDSRGHHVLHLRVPKSHKKQVLLNQIEIIKHHLVSITTDSQKHLTLIRDVTPQDLEKRINTINQKLEQLESDESTDEWVLFNGPNVSSTYIEDALGFHVSFKEPCIITYRQIDDNEEVETIISPKVEIPPGILASTRQIDDITDLIAFDAEFVQVQHEESILTATGSKMVLREGRNALGRMSLVDCRTGRTIIDDHVLPREPIVDYLTRFSGIKPADLNPKTSSHHLISSKNAYLKMRYLVDRGCIFVGHGLSQDFLTVNIFVPPSQIIDTTNIFYLEHKRLISLRFLVNYLLGRDMQQDVHDSIEDSKAACELYMKALELKKQGVFDKVIREIYDCGSQIDWKVGELNNAGH